MTVHDGTIHWDKNRKREGDEFHFNYFDFVESKGYLGGDIKQADVYRSLVERSGS